LSHKWIFYIQVMYIIYLVGGWARHPPWKMMEWKSAGMMKFPIWWESHKIPWFQSPPTRYKLLTTSDSWDDPQSVKL
jgi:hypothetical protein